MGNQLFSKHLAKRVDKRRFNCRQSIEVREDAIARLFNTEHLGVVVVAVRPVVNVLFVHEGYSLSASVWIGLSCS